ncbi:STAS domain-containing protein [Antrihabitans stalactiti]
MSSDFRQPDNTVETSLMMVDGVTVLAVAGSLDLLTMAEFQDAVDSALDTEPVALIIDLTEVEFLASAGMSVLISASRGAAHIPFAVVADGPATSRPIRLTALDTVFSLTATREEAVRNCTPRPSDIAAVDPAQVHQ